METASLIHAYFAKLNLEQEIADIYLSLYTYGPQSMSELSRSSKVERTRLYRLIDKLRASNLIEVESHHKRGTLRAAPITNLQMLIAEKEQEVKSLRDDLALIQQVLKPNLISSPATRIQFYQGQEGIRQMLWNELKARNEIVGYNYRILEEGVGKKFMERWSEEFEHRRLHFHLITGDDFAASWAEGRQVFGKGTSKRIKGITYHCISRKTFNITHSCDVYDNVVSYYHWKQNGVFGIEIYNQEIADTQREFFEMLWAKSQPETRF